MSSIQEDAFGNLFASGLFDSDWYASTYPDVLISGLTPAEHFWRLGRRLGRHGSANAHAIHSGERGTEIAVNLQTPGNRHSESHSAIPVALRQQIAKSRLFDEKWYSERYHSITRDTEDLIQDYHDAFEADIHRDPGPLFSTAHYQMMNPDVIGMHPFVHFIEYGLREGRAAFPAQKVNHFLERADHRKVLSISSLMIDVDGPIKVLYWNDGNFFFKEIAEYVAFYLNQLGFPAECTYDVDTQQIATNNVIIVAPHEFCVHGPGRLWSAAHLESVIYLNTEQWQTTWFSLAYGFVIKSGAVLDINPSSAAGFAELGFRAGFIPLLPLEGSCFSHPITELSPSLLRSKAVKELTFPSEFASRPYDLLFVGVLNKKRGRAIGSIAPVLQAYDCFLHCPEFRGPVRETDADMISNRDLAQLCRNSKILLNIHQGDAAYFEWHRMFISGIMEGCVVITEPCVPPGFVYADEHYLEATMDEMPSLLDYLLGTVDGRETLRRIHRNCDKLRLDIKAGKQLAHDYSRS